MSNKNEPLDLSHLYDAGKWYQFPFVLVGLYGPIPAMLLAFLLNRFHSTGTQLGGSIWVSAKFVDSAFYGRLSKDQQKRHLLALKRRGVITIRRGEPPTGGSQRLVSINKRELNYQITQFLLQCGEVGREQKCALGREQKCALKKNNREEQTITEPAPAGLSNRSGLLGLDDKDDTTFGDRCTKRLIKTLLHHRKMMRRPNPKSWAKIFTTLETQLGRKRVHGVLKWYRAHLGEEFVPVAYSAQAFADKFLRIEESMKRTNKRYQAAEPIVPTEEETKVMQDLEILTWPKGAGATLPASVRESLAQYHSWEKVLRRFRTTHRDDHTYCRFIDQLYASMFLSPRSFLLVWYQKIYDKAQNWEGWIPDLMREAWRPTHPEFQRMGRAEASAYFGNSMKWDTFSGRMQALAKDEN